MEATEDILSVWRKFDDFPMETLTKAWLYAQVDTGQPGQRTVEQMKVHRATWGTSGNCYDLAIWLMQEFRDAKLESYCILTPDAHVAVIARNGDGLHYLCDLGDLWIQPILLEPAHASFSEDFQSGFFPAADVKLEMRDNKLNVVYRRPNGKHMQQQYLLTPLTDDQLMTSAEQTQRTLYSPLVEKRIVTAQEVMHWEFDAYTSFVSTRSGKKLEPKLDTIEAWSERIAQASGMHAQVVKAALEEYERYRRSSE